MEDRWNGNIPEGAIAKVRLLSPYWWIEKGLDVGFWAWSFVWWGKVWEVSWETFWFGLM